MSIAFIHSSLRNLVLYFGPIILISASLILSISNVSLYKQSLIQNNFYTQIATEFNQAKPLIDTQKLSLQDQFYNNLIWDNIDNKLNSKDWLKNVTETNIDRADSWIIGKANTFEPYLPLETQKITTSKPSWLTDVTNSSSKTFDQLKDQASKLNLPKIDILPALEIQKIPENIINPSNINSLNPINQVNQTWVNVWNGIRTYYWQLQSLAWTAITLYGLALLGLVVTSLFFGKNPILELAIISQKLGLNLLISGAFFIFGVSAVFLTGAIIKSLIPTTFLIGNIVGIINWQIIWFIISTMTPLLIVAGFLTVGGFITGLVIPTGSKR